MTGLLLQRSWAVVGIAGWRVLGQMRRTRMAEESYRLLADHCTDVVFKLDLQCRFDFVTPSALERVGIPPERLLGSVIFQYIHPEDREAAAATYRAVAAGSGPGDGPVPAGPCTTGDGCGWRSS